MNVTAQYRDRVSAIPESRQHVENISNMEAVTSDAVVPEKIDTSADYSCRTHGNEQGLSCLELSFRRTPSWKRAIDIAVSSLLIVGLSPVLALIAGYIWFRDGGPILFKQPRLGSMGKSFVIYKFRTLKCSEKATADHRQFVSKLSSQNSLTTKPDLSKRAIPGGIFLRKTSLDELPQLWNILRGDMSLIGPRPDVLHWDDYQPWQRRRFEVAPGVTGLWQVSGKNRLTFNQMIDKDIEYVEKRSIWLDFSIAIRTFRLILKRDNV